MFQPVDGQVRFPKLEEETVRFWKEQQIYHKSLAQREGAPPFVFYEGPPTANGMPHPGHCLTRAIKDVFPRYKTMRGFRCERKAGWDTHGLPVEVEVCKELGIHSKEEIEAYGIEPFIQKCQASVWRYMQEWERLTERLGFWVDLDEAYVTYHQSYVESVWWSLKTLFDKGLLYQGHKIVWWWAQGGTALSAGEVGQGYKQVADPSVFVKFPLLKDGQVTKTSLLVWTTTPWTLPSNQFAAVHPDIDYATVEDSETGEILVLASDLVETIAGKLKRELKVISTCKGTELVGQRYLPPFECFYTLDAAQHRLALQEKAGAGSGAVPFALGGAQRGKLTGGEEEYLAWRVVAADFVTTESGSGIVHQAPAFGEVDYEVLVAEQDRFARGEGPTLINCVGPNGKFTDEAPEFVRGRWVKDCDKEINRDLKERGLLYFQEQYLHDYPFCWRAEEDPLIQYPRESWFIKTTQFKEAMQENNRAVNWLPGHIKEGRFGKFLASNVDWALSRERYWGTPLPIWQCEQTGKQEAIGDYDEVLAKPGVRGTDVWDQAKAANPELPDDLRVHKPYIDAVTYDSPFAEGARMQRVTEVIDCWYDSGAMPFAQWGYKGQESGPEKERFESQFPADFISEAIDQTRGWFYSQLSISTMLFGERRGTRDERQGKEAEPPRPSPLYPHPFKNCIVLGLMLGEDGQKMSKSKRNYRDPSEIFDLYGADALRWYLFANQPPWTSIRYSEQAIKDSVPEFLLRLWNCYSFFVIYANIDGFDPSQELDGKNPPPQKGEGLGEGAEASTRSAKAVVIKEHLRRAPDKPDIGSQKTVPVSRRTSDDADTRVPSPSPSPSPKKGRGISALTAEEFAAADSYRPVGERDELDRWILTELHRTTALVTERMDAYDNYGACSAITEFVDGLSNWWVRRSRERFWSKDKREPAKLDAYWTLYECLITTSKLIAPFTPFLAETFWQNLAGVFDDAPESVHLCDYPETDVALLDTDLSERMSLVRLIASHGRQARSTAEIKVRQPLSKVEVILARTKHRSWLEEHADVIKGELNVKAVEYSDEPEKYVDHEVLPNFKLLGKKLGKLMPKLKQALNVESGSELLANFRDNGKINITVEGQDIELLPEEVEIRITAKPGWAAANGRGVVVVLSTEITPELLREGMARDLVRAIQDRRKEMGCEFTDRIEVSIATDSADLRETVTQFADYIAGETLADTVQLAEKVAADAVEVKVGEVTAQVEVLVRP